VRKNNTRQAVILAGGKGTRLHSRLNGLPKPMAPILGKPLLQHLIEQCATNGITDIRLLIAYRGEVIKDNFGDGNQIGVTIQYYMEDQARGTAGALLDVLEDLDDQFLVIYGDTYFDVDLNKLWSFHIDRNADTTLFLHPNDHPQDSDLVEIDQYLKVTEIHTYPHPDHQWHQNLVNAALYMFNKTALIGMKLPLQRPDIAKNLFPKMLELGKSLYGYVSTEYIKDMGTPERLDCVEQDIISGKVAALSSNVQKSALFLDRDGVINHEVNHLSDLEQLELLPGVGKAIRKANQAGILVVVITNQPVIARGDITEMDLRIIHNKLETLLGYERAYIDALYYCPHHPDSGFDGEVSELKIECDCRKPSAGLLLQAAKKLNISLRESWMVGDSTSDILAAIHAGVRNILVRTGYAGRDGKYSCVPDYVAANLGDAVDWVVMGHQALAAKVESYLAKAANSRLVLIGGLARSGKSSLSQIITEKLVSQGQSVKVFSLDNWLIPQEARSPNDGVLERFDMKAVVEFSRMLKSTRQLLTHKVFPYDRFTKSYTDQSNTVNINRDDVVIIEGVPALCNPKLLMLADYSFFMVCDESIRKVRLWNDYKWRGLDKVQFEALYSRREIDERTLISSSSIHADVVIQVCGAQI
jgi:D,D-heptose 1,7-bisphosphate phosphatase